MVIGTTGHAPEEKVELLKIAAHIPCVWAGNFSVGVNLLYALRRAGRRTLGDDYDAEVIEMHHRLKKDAQAARPRVCSRLSLRSVSSAARPFATGAKG